MLCTDCLEVGTTVPSAKRALGKTSAQGVEEEAGTAGAPAAGARAQPPAGGKAGGGWARAQGGEPAAEPERGEELGDDAFAGFSERVESWLVRRGIAWARLVWKVSGKNCSHSALWCMKQVSGNTMQERSNQLWAGGFRGC